MDQPLLLIPVEIPSHHCSQTNYKTLHIQLAYLMIGKGCFKNHGIENGGGSITVRKMMMFCVMMLSLASSWYLYC